MRFCRGISSLVAIAGLCVAAPAAANGKFPAAGQIVIDPGDPAHVVVRTTFGLLVSRDAGETFDWICESGAGYGGNVDPGIALTSDGAIIAGIVGGLDVGRGQACSWQLAGGPIANQAIVDVSALKTKPKAAVALAATAAGNVVFRSDDDAATWAQAGAALPPAFQAITLDVAPSDPSRFYVSGLDNGSDGGAPVAALARSPDGGATWEIRPITGAADRAPYLAAVDPNDAAVVYVRLDGTPGTLLVTKDAGETWKTVLTIPGFMQAFALAPDGATVLAGGPNDGLFRAAASTYDFTRVSSVGVRCLSWSSGGDVYACGSLFAVGRSTDMGDTFTPLLRLECLRGPLACDPATSVGMLCPAEWEQLKTKIGSQYCALFGGPDAGSGGAGGSSSGGGAPPASGCGCRMGGEAEHGAAALLLGLALVGARRRRATRS